jgi:hypothetical protein
MPGTTEGASSQWLAPTSEVADSRAGARAAYRLLHLSPALVAPHFAALAAETLPELPDVFRSRSRHALVASLRLRIALGVGILGGAP